MEDFSLVDKLKVLMNTIISSPLFLFCSMMGVAVLIYYIISIKSNKKINKWIFISIWIVLAIALLVNYSKTFFNLLDSLMDDMFNALYFPSLAIYIIILIIINFSFFYSVVSKKLERKKKILNFTCSLIIDILLILVIDIVQTNEINVYVELNLYSNSTLLVLLELTSAIFVSWILISLLISAHSKLKKYDKSKGKNIPEIIFEDI